VVRVWEESGRIVGRVTAELYEDGDPVVITGASVEELCDAVRAVLERWAANDPQL
jgi:hypothetical protein